LKKNPDSLVTCKIRVELLASPTGGQNDASKKGDTVVVVVEQTLKIVMDTPYVVRPSIPTEDRDTTRVRQRKKTFEVKMTRGGKPVANHPIRLWTDYVVESGGHEHGDTRNVRRENNDNNYGYFTIGQATHHRRPFDTLTNAGGKFAVTYSASIFGDTMKIYLKSRHKTLLLDSISIAEKVDSLINFRNVASNSRWTFSQTATGETRHPDNNWCIPNFSDSLQLAIDNFNEWTKTKKGGGRAVAVSLNDMTLQLGGRFDISGRWDGRNSQAHLFHRVGTSVDVNPTLSGVQLQKLTEKMGEQGLERNAERRQIHYGSNGGN
jgi:hypothetical protein